MRKDEMLAAFKEKLLELLNAKRLQGRFRFTRQKMIINELEGMALQITDKAEKDTATAQVEKVRDLMGTNSYLLRDLGNYLETGL